jgi:adenylosuccinate synthase
LASLNVPPSAIGTVVGTARTFPIRVGNVKDTEGNQIGYSGDVYEGQKELTWDEVTKLSGAPKPLLEHTTLTNKVRRIFTFSHKAMRKAVAANDVDFLFLNFMNYLDFEVYGASTSDTLNKSKRCTDFIDTIQKQCLVKVKWAGCGPQNNHIVEL